MSRYRFQRPAWSTGTLIPLCCLCGIGAAILIWHGGHKTKRTKEVQEKLRQVLAMRGPTNVNTTVTNIEHATSSITGVAVPLFVVARKQACFLLQFLAFNGSHRARVFVLTMPK